ncbi:unnamed protein product [Linum trigynum]|uniref:Uncharacterized protein n=1 Tax=Linum trigynum TaxID=586398 RepID=A0AAV2G2G2_9ROSI
MPKVIMRRGGLRSGGSLIKRRLKVCHEEEDQEAIEKRLGYSQVEDGRNELKHIVKMIELVPWGVPDEYECEVTEDDVLDFSCQSMKNVTWSSPPRNSTGR